MSTSALLRERIAAACPDAAIAIRDDSAEHAGHAEAGEARASHFSVTVASPSFASLSPVARHRKIYAAVGDLRELGIHALQINASAAGQALAGANSASQPPGKEQT